MNNNQSERDYINQARKKAQINNVDGLGFLTLLSVGLSGGSLLLGIALLFSYNGLANRPMPALVQMANGKTIKVATLNDGERTPRVIKDFVGLSMTKIMTWRNYLPPKTAEEISAPVIDPGVAIPSSEKGGSSSTAKIATSAWKASFALSSDLQNSFLNQLASLSTTVSAGGGETALEILNLGEPIKVQAGSWKVPMVANLVILQKGSSLPRRVSFNKDIYTQVVEVPKIIEGGQPGAQELSEITAEAKSSGLQIYAISDLERENIKPSDNGNFNTPTIPAQPIKK
jgi:hypothetical protein